MYQAAAQGLASLGRGQDKMLVHMTPGEVGGLQQLAMAHGGSLTVNPHTGLPEAGFLSSILPTVAGAALMATPLGPALGPLGVAGLIGGGSYLLNPKQGLMGGLMAGLGAYGGAGLGSALAGTGSEAAQLAVAEEMAKAQFGMPPEQASALADAANRQALGDTIPPEIPIPPPTAEQIQGVQQDAMLASGMRPFDISKETQQALARSPYENMKAGLGSVTSSMDAAKDFYNKNKTAVLAAAPVGLAAFQALSKQSTPAVQGAAPSTFVPQQYTFRQVRNPNWNVYPYQPYYSEQEFVRTAANGGLMQALQGMHPGAKIPSTYAAGGKLLRGPGDGMSDSIPAVIEGAKPQRAALADGEFVIPADVVSHLGNGSTEAGSRHLYNMMDRVRKARTGNVKQGRQIRPEKYMPA